MSPAPRRLAQLSAHLFNSSKRTFAKKAPLAWQLNMNAACSGSAAGDGDKERDLRTAAFLVIGDEILSGKTQDTNSHVYLAQKCFSLGLDLRRIEVVPDIQEDIIERARYLSERYGWVFTSGGIGPTHDDITYQSLSLAFPSLRLEYHAPTISKMQLWLDERNASLSPGQPKLEMTTARKRMALLPSGGEPGREAQHLVPDPSLWVPVVVVNNNVAIFPGVPRLFRGLVDAFLEKEVLPKLPAPESYERALVATGMYEADIADALTDIAEASAGEGIKIGSYPKSPPLINGQRDLASWKIKVVVSVVGKDPSIVAKWADVVKGKVEGWSVTLEETKVLE